MDGYAQTSSTYDNDIYIYIVGSEATYTKKNLEANTVIRYEIETFMYLISNDYFAIMGVIFRIGQALWAFSTNREVLCVQ